VVLPPLNVRDAANPTDSILARGRDVYRANCVSCHGENGQGDGPAGVVLNPKPRDFRNPSGWTNGAGIVQIYRTLQEGIVKNGMASYAYLPPGDRFALIHLVRTFHPAPPADTEQDILGLDTTYQLSKGTVLAAQIPLGDAARRLIEEHASSVARIEAESQGVVIAEDPDEALFAHVAADPARALTAMQAARSRITTLDDFMRLVSADPVQLGFRTSVSQLSRTDWAMLHQFVMR
jgi:mono/diheme cytochrome c family protein